MKKTWLIGIVLILAFAAMSCDSAWAPIGDVTDPVEEAIQYTADGRQMVNLSIPTGGGGDDRALTNDLAQAAVNYYEVVFYDGTKYYRTAGYKGQTLRLSVPAGNYAGAAKAIMFAGRSSDRTLLAAGIISAHNPAVNGTTINLGDISAATTQVTFTLAPLETDIRNAASSTFKITAPATYLTVTDGNFGLIPFEGKSFPRFRVPAGVNTTTADFGINGLIDTAAGIVFKTADPALTSFGFGSNQPVKVVGKIVATAGLPIPNTGLLPLTIDTTNTAIPNGYSLIFINVPVMAISTAGGGDTWYIRGGLNNYEPDLGKDLKSTAGGVVLEVGTPDTDGGFVVSE